MSTTVIAAQKCPGCGYPVDRATSVNHHARPTPGDFTVCIGCGEPMRFRPDLTLAIVTMSQVPSYLWPTIDTVRLGVQLTHAKLGKPAGAQP